jgi:formyltetrahydrofolate deformylase
VNADKPTSTIATLLVSCPDRKGLVAALAQLLYGHGANIVDSDQHTDAEAGQFFQRIRFDLAEIHTDRVALERGVAEVSQRFGMSVTLRYPEAQTRVDIFVSRYGHCLDDLLWRYGSGELPCVVRLVVSNHPDLGELARRANIPFYAIPVTSTGKEAAEAQAFELLDSHGIDLLVFARYMQVVSPEFIERYPSRIINIHHSFLPAFVGQKPYHQAYERGVKLIGATAHYATADLDEGPIIEQGVARISHRDTVDDLVRKGRDLEKVVLANAVRLHLEDRVLVVGKRTVVFD